VGEGIHNPFNILPIYSGILHFGKREEPWYNKLLSLEKI
jgi:hypothetical protein